MIAVSNTTPLRHLIAIHQEHIFEKLFGQIVIPGAVLHELSRPRTPEVVRNLISRRPAWLVTRTVTQPTEQFNWPRLHRGEREAITLAEALHADVLLIDDKYGRAAARSRNLRLNGTLGVLEEADSQGLLTSFPLVLDELKKSGFFLKPHFEASLLRRYEQRRREKESGR